MSLAWVAFLLGCQSSAEKPAASEQPVAGPAKVSAAATSPEPAMAPKESSMNASSKTIHELEVERLTGERVKLSSYQGKTLLVVNTASRCGYTPQLGRLQQLQARYGSRGFSVLGFPSNDFGGQEPGTSEQIGSFASDKYGVEFPLFAKSHAKGDELAPVFALLTSSPAAQGPIKWNFTKFLVGPDGQVQARFEPRVDPLSDEVTRAIEASLEQS